MLMPPCSTAPRVSGMPERILPVMPGWMPTPVEGLLKRPLMTLSLVLYGSRGCRLLLSSIAAPSPFAHQLFGLIPVPMNWTTKRFGGVLAALGASAAAPHTGRDSSQGRAMTTPAPRRKMRRESGPAGFCILVRHVCHSRLNSFAKVAQMRAGCGTAGS